MTYVSRRILPVTRAVGATARTPRRAGEAALEGGVRACRRHPKFTVRVGGGSRIVRVGVETQLRRIRLADREAIGAAPRSAGVYGVRIIVALGLHVVVVPLIP